MPQRRRRPAWAAPIDPFAPRACRARPTTDEGLPRPPGATDILDPTVRTRSWTRRATFAADLLLLAACATTGAGDPDPTPVTGNLAVAITGLPSGTDVDGLTYGGLISLSPALVLPEETTLVTVTYQGVAFPHMDAASNPGIHAQFRKTSGAPVWVDRMLFNASTPIDTRGMQLRNDVSNPGDPFDFLAFRLVHGDSPTTRVTMSLECGFEAEIGSVIDAVLTDSAGNKIGTDLSCGSTRNYSIPNVGGAGNCLVRIGSASSMPFYTDYVLSINAYCFQACTYVPYEE